MPRLIHDYEVIVTLIKQTHTQPSLADWCLFPYFVMPLQVNSKNSANCQHWSNLHVYLKSNPIHWVQDNALCVLSASIAQVAGRKVNANMIYYRARRHNCVKVPSTNSRSDLFISFVELKFYLRNRVNNMIVFIASFCGINLVIINDWPTLSHRLLWF